MIGDYKDKAENCNFKYKIYRERSVFEGRAVALLSFSVLLIIYYNGIISIWMNIIEHPLYIIAMLIGFGLFLIPVFALVLVWPCLFINNMLFHKKLIFEEDRLVCKSFFIQKKINYNAIDYAKVAFEYASTNPFRNSKMIILINTEKSKYKIVFRNRAVYNELVCEMQKHFKVKEQ